MKSSNFAKALSEKVIGNSLDGILAYDLDCRYTVWNPAMERITGFRAEEIIGHRTFEKFPFLLETGEHQFFLQALEGKNVLSMDRHYSIPENRKDGHFEAIYGPLYDDQNSVIGGFSLVRDTSEWKRTYRALRESELKLRNVSRVATDAIVICNRNGRILSWNASADSLFGYTEKEVLGTDVARFVPGYDWVSSFFTSAHATETLSGYFALKRNGSSVPISISASKWNLGEDAFLSLALKDLSEVTHLEIQAAEHRELAEALMQAQNEFNQGVVVVDTESDRAVFVNEAFSRMTGYTKEELMALPQMSNLIEPQEIPLVRKRIEARLRANKLSDFYETTLIDKSGKSINVEVGIRQMETSFGITSFSLIRNVSLRKENERVLRQSERRSHEIINSLPFIVCTFSEEGLIQTLSRAFQQQLGFKPSDYFQKPFASLFYIGDQDNFTHKALQTKPNQCCDARIITADHRLIEVKVFLSQIWNKSENESRLATIQVTPPV